MVEEERTSVGSLINCLGSSVGMDEVRSVNLTSSTENWFVEGKRFGPENGVSDLLENLKEYFTYSVHSRNMNSKAIEMLNLNETIFTLDLIIPLVSL